MDKRQLEQVIHRSVKKVLQEKGIQVVPSQQIPVSVSARHVHLSSEHVEKLFGRGYELTYFRDISQPGQYACQERVTIKGPKGQIENVRILGPARGRTQVEVAKTDARQLGLEPPVRMSGDIKGSEPITILASGGKALSLEEGCIIADRHIHMTPADADFFEVAHGDLVAVSIAGEKPGVLGNVRVRVKDSYKLDMHIDTDDGNAFLINGSGHGRIVKESR